LAGGPKVAAGVRALIFAHRRVSEARLEKVWSHVLQGDDDSEAFSERIADAVLQDGDELGYAFTAAARAAVDAVDPSVLVSIGLLARRFVQTQTPSRREYTAYLDMFESLDAIEFGALRKAVRVLAATPGSRVSTTVTAFPPMPGIEWSLTGRDVVLADGTSALQLVRGLEQVIEARGTAMTANAPELPRDMIQLLMEVVPSDALYS
jgi:hypothetical protein